MTAEGVDRRALDDHLEMVGNRIATHAGGIEVIDLSDDGVLKLRFTGMCSGCPYRPMTMAATIRPALLSVSGITRVDAAGSRVSAEAEGRFAGYLASTGESPSPIDSA